jgi:hypothetical protein
MKGDVSTTKLRAPTKDEADSWVKIIRSMASSMPSDDQHSTQSLSSAQAVLPLPQQAAAGLCSASLV